MSIVFFCQSCGARFEIDASAAGRKGRCKQCGQRMIVPKAAELASMTSMPALAAASAGGQASNLPISAASWLAGMSGSSVRLAPLTVESMPLGARKAASPLDDEPGDSNPYELAADRKPRRGRAESKPASAATLLWRNQLTSVIKIFRWINETAYLISVPFLILLLFGVVVRSPHLVQTGAIVVVILNVGRFISGFINLAAIPFRDGIDQGVQFLVPPLTFVYLYNHWNKVKKATRRLVEPILTMGLVALAFTFIPWLAKGGAAGDVKPRTGFSSFEEKVGGDLEKARSIGVDPKYQKGGP
jgi:DNA-directed RNA polymerase subunit RPC12/RpoP